jgi:hypothetical protein
VDESQTTLNGKKVMDSLLAKERIVRHAKEGEKKFRLKTGDNDKGDELDF